MKIFTAQQIRDGDAYTVAHEPIQSIDLMERAARACVEWIKAHFSSEQEYYIFCGTGNNGGDGLAISRMLHEGKYKVHSFIVFSSKHSSEDFNVNRLRLEHEYGSRLTAIHQVKDFPEIPGDAIVIDALFGTGLNRQLSGLAADTVSMINHQKNKVISIDLPSGLMADQSSVNGEVIQANYTLSFQFYKTAFLMPENAKVCGQIEVLPIGIHEDYIKNTHASIYLTEKKEILSIYKKRNSFSHKGNFGHALIMAGSFGKMGAAVLSAKACMKTGAGLLTCHVPHCGYPILQTSFPEAMCSVDSSEEIWTDLPDSPEKYSCIGVGPGIDKNPETAITLEKLLSVVQKPMVIDADALNIIGENKHLLNKIPRFSLLTPHPKEFERLFGKTSNDFDRMNLQIENSKKYGIFIVLKGHHTCISTPEGLCHFNNTGNAGMATAGSGDTLTGILTSLLAQGYLPEQAAVFGVYLHGLAGDLAVRDTSEESLTATDICNYLGEAFKTL